LLAFFVEPLLLRPIVGKCGTDEGDGAAEGKEELERPRDMVAVFMGCHIELNSQMHDQI
jgi:hypothetical protein